MDLLPGAAECLHPKGHPLPQEPCLYSLTCMSLFTTIHVWYVHAHVYRCEWRPEVNNGRLPQLLSFLFLIQSLLLNMELLVWMASKPQRPSFLCFPK